MPGIICICIAEMLLRPFGASDIMLNLQCTAVCGFYLYAAFLSVIEYIHFLPKIGFLFRRNIL